MSYAGGRAVCSAPGFGLRPSPRHSAERHPSPNPGRGDGTTRTERRWRIEGMGWGTQIAERWAKWRAFAEVDHGEAVEQCRGGGDLSPAGGLAGDSGREPV